MKPEPTVENVVYCPRSDPDQVVAIAGGGYRRTRLEDLREGGYCRTDIALVNLRQPHCPTCTCDLGGVQACVFATTDGTLAGDGVRWLTDEQRAWCEAENARLIAVAEVHPEFHVYLTEQW